MRTVLAVFTGFILSFAAAAADLKVFSTIALSDTWPDLKPVFEKRGHRLELVMGTSGALGKQIAEGAVGDVIVSTNTGIEGLVAGGKALGATARPFASSAIGVAVAKGARKPDISTPAAFKAALLAAKSVAYSDPAGGGASGVYMVKVLEKLGIVDQVNAKAKRGRGIPNAEFVVKGESDLAIQQIPELMHVKGVDVVGPFPGELGNLTHFSAAVLMGTWPGNAYAAAQLVEFLGSRETQALLKAKGFEITR